MVSSNVDMFDPIQYELRVCYPIFEVDCVCLTCMVVSVWNLYVYYWFDMLSTAIYCVGDDEC